MHPGFEVDLRFAHKRRRGSLFLLVLTAPVGPTPDPAAEAFAGLRGDLPRHVGVVEVSATRGRELYWFLDLFSAVKEAGGRDPTKIELLRT